MTFIYDTVIQNKYIIIYNSKKGFKSKNKNKLFKYLSKFV